jgi:hypothetical protein
MLYIQTLLYYQPYEGASSSTYYTYLREVRNSQKVGTNFGKTDNIPVLRTYLHV